jgi:hypothetical protein
LEAQRGRIDYISANKPSQTISLADAFATGRDALPRDPASHVRGRRTDPIAQERVAETAKKASRHTAPDARERIPTGAGEVARSYHFYFAYRDSTLTRNRGLRVGPLKG